LANAQSVASLWDLEARKKIALLKPSESLDEEISDALCAPGGEWIATGHRDTTLRIWESDSGKLLTTLKSHGNEITALAVSVGAQFLASGGGGLEYLPADNTLRVWDTRSWREIATLSGHSQPIDAISFSHDGKKLASTSRDATARVWDIGAQQELLRIALREHCNCRVSFARTGKSVLISAEAHGVDFSKVYDSNTGSELFSLEGYYAKYSSDYTRILTVKNDKLLVWDAVTGKLLSSIDGHTSWLTSAAFDPRLTPNGKMAIATASNDGSVRISTLNTSTQALVDEAKARVPRCLTQPQRAQYFLPQQPPRWCITGAALQKEPDPANWKPKWPYANAAWRAWLQARDRGEAPAIPTNTN
jgi:WD40 repeat protein